MEKIFDITTVEWPLVVGPEKLSDRGISLDFAVRILLGIELTALETVSARQLKPAFGTENNVRLILGSATEQIGAFDAEMHYIRLNGRGIGIDPAIMSRMTYLAKDGDMLVGRSAPWRQSAESARNNLSELSILDIGEEQLYYTSHALLYLAITNKEKLAPMVNYLSRNPEAVVSVYTLDVEMQIFLNWLATETGLRCLLVDANAPEVARDWNHKGILYPTVLEAGNMNSPSWPQNDVDSVLRAEGSLSQLGSVLTTDIPRIPGYRIEWQSSCDAFVEQVLAAGRMLNDRYGLQFGCLKPSRSSDGAGIISGIPLNNGSEIRKLAHSIWESEMDYVMEAHLKYLSFQIDRTVQNVSPSVHIQNGIPQEDMTLQFTENGEWRGNISVGEQDCVGLGVPAHIYELIKKSQSSVAEAFGQIGIIKCGFDFGVGRIGGFFGDRVLVAAQDPNIRTFGAEYMYALKKIVRLSGLDGQVATRVIKPSPTASHVNLLELARSQSGLDVMYDVIAVVPPGWGMVGASGQNAKAAAFNVLSFEERLRESGLVI